MAGFFLLLGFEWFTPQLQLLAAAAALALAALCTLLLRCAVQSL